MNSAILLAAGKSQRAKQNKLWFEWKGLPLWLHAYNSLLANPNLGEIIIVASDLPAFEPYLKEKTKLVEEGETWMESFKLGLAASKGECVLVHNAANPHLTQQEINEVLEAAQNQGAAAVSHPAVDTLIQVENGAYSQALDRTSIRLMQTPQGAKRSWLEGLPEATDLSSALLAKGHKVLCLEASPFNKKITYPQDLQGLGARYFLGEDSHRFSSSGTLRLAGLDVPGHPALEANSDGDVILHALGRALAQANGKQFSEVADPLCSAGERNSQSYLAPLFQNVNLQNVSIQIEAKTPKMDELPLRESLAKILAIPQEHIQISAMTGEGLTAFGRGEGIRCLALITVL
jgi:2-C-methyl-D-erythritol 4-phosphate cytidylyltransferase/2-C-methyl-D-erythritol 2,4-cyclodiphosphate synthase